MKKLSKQVLKKAHNACFQNKKLLERSKKCACICCNNIFSPTEIEEWCDDNTALCPYCCIDSVIGDAAGYSLTEEFILQMHMYWFGLSDKMGDGHKWKYINIIIDET